MLHTTRSQKGNLTVYKDFNFRRFTNLLILTLITSIPSFGAVLVIRNGQNLSITPSNPYEVSGGTCWEGIRFTSGFVQESFQNVLTSQGYQVNLKLNIKLQNGVGVISGPTGVTYSAAENFQYNDNLKIGQEILPQRLFLRITSSDGKVAMVVIHLIFLTDWTTNTYTTLLYQDDIICQ